MIANYLNSVIKQFEYYKSLGDKCFVQLSEEDIHKRWNAEDNSIAVIVNHLSGNMLSRWTDFLTTDGEKDWRNRDREFEDVIKSKADLIEQWEKGWMCLFGALYGITPDNFNRKVFIRNQEHTIIEAFNRQMGHYAYHVGQIVMLAKSIKGEDWNNLSIPKGKSEQFNQDKKKMGQHGGHFSDDLK